MNNQPIALFDSGLGGLPYLQWLTERLPEESFVYAADTLHFPYGEKTPKEVLQAVRSSVGVLIEETNPKLVVIACNTASVVALDVLRRTHHIPFVGVVPAVKPAAQASRERRIGILATQRTVNDEYTERLVREFASDCIVERAAPSELVRFVEDRFFDAPDVERQAVVARAVKTLKRARVDAVVLGCTHFVYLSDVIAKELGNGVSVLDSRDGVGRQVIRVLDREGLRARSGRRPGPGQFFVTGFSHGNTDEDLTSSGETDGKYRTFALKFGLEYGGVFSTLRTLRQGA